MGNTIDNNNIALHIEDLSIAYTKDKYAVKGINADIYKNTITAIMGPSGCGKSTLLRAINRMHELYPEIKVTGNILMKNQNIFKINAMEVRQQIGMVFQRPNPFPSMSIYENVIAGYSLNGIKLKKNEKDKIVQEVLEDVGLWDEVKDTLHKRRTALSGGQQQRLCIARSIAMKPDILLLDEPTSALDPISTSKIEDLLIKLKEKFTIVIVTHNMSQAARISEYSMFMYLGDLIEYDLTKKMFTNPNDKRTEQYLTGKFG